jgi:hypothetical protein
VATFAAQIVAAIGRENGAGRSALTAKSAAAGFLYRRPLRCFSGSGLLQIRGQLCFRCRRKLRFRYALFGGVPSALAACGTPASAFCASAILARAAPLIFRRLRFVGSVVAAGSAEPGDSIALCSAILRSIFFFWDSKPWMAAVIISVVSLCVGIAAIHIIHGSAVWTVKEGRKRRHRINFTELSLPRCAIIYIT